MSKEIERKYLVKNFGMLCDQYRRIRQDDIRQGYLAIEPSGTEVRVRSKGLDDHQRYYLTAKCGQGLVRGEAEMEINREQFEVLWPMTEGRRVEKIRFTLALSDKLKLEVDCFFGKLASLIIAEIEFTTEEEANTFTPPIWLGADVTIDKRYKNQNLATTESASALQP